MCYAGARVCPETSNVPDGLPKALKRPRARALCLTLLGEYRSVFDLTDTP